MTAINQPVGYDPLPFYQELATAALEQFSLPADVAIKLLNYSENVTYLVESEQDGTKQILRLNRPGYHTKKELEAELIWIESILESSSLEVAEPIAGKNGEYVQVIAPSQFKEPYHCVMFSFLSGQSPDETNEKGLSMEFEKLGEVTAQLHNQSQGWAGSQSLARPTWDFETMLGSNPTWGRWQDGVAVTPARRKLFQAAADKIEQRLRQFGQSKDRFGLIHADLRLANLLVEDGAIKIIDFDDCGFSWYLYDLATALSFIEHKEYVPELIQAWLAGYKKIRSLSKEEEEMIPTFIMLRRLLLIGWVGSHIDNDTAQSLGAGFTEETVALAEKYLLHFK
ncbi:phosphotransferase enzyme family protein [Neobacillus muris]|uniref:phosphotransferase enzyme family protein n=1 Tax=Neobacillus muris TaxID=2941334 RepID=UPI00203C37D0|nr:phosphotransferase [Neobacillus muris]